MPALTRIDQPVTAETDARSPVALVCGSGAITAAVAESAIQRGRDVLMFAIKGVAEPRYVERFRHRWIGLGQLGAFYRIARAEGCRDVVFIGAVVRPRLRSIRFDWTGLKSIPRLISLFRGGDDHLLSGVAALIQEQGFRMVAAHELAPDIVVVAGPLGTHAPTERDRADIDRALDVLRAVGALDVGQAAVVADHYVLAIEAADGTDGMLEHIAMLREKGRIPTGRGVGVLVKAPKPGQDRRFDLPSIGPLTIEGAAKAGLAGIAVIAGETLIAEPARVALLADSAGMFVYGVDPGVRR